MLPQTQLAEHLKPASLPTHRRYSPVFGCRYSCTGRSIQSREQRKFLVVYIQQIGNENSTYALASFNGTHHSAWRSLRRPRLVIISALWESYRRAVTVNRSFLITQINIVASNIQGTFLFSFHRSMFLPCVFESYATTEFPDDNSNRGAQCFLVERGPLTREGAETWVRAEHEFKLSTSSI